MDGTYNFIHMFGPSIDVCTLRQLPSILDAVSDDSMSAVAQLWLTKAEPDHYLLKGLTDMQGSKRYQSCFAGLTFEVPQIPCGKEQAREGCYMAQEAEPFHCDHLHLGGWLR